MNGDVKHRPLIRLDHQTEDVLGAVVENFVSVLLVGRVDKHFVDAWL